MTTPDRQGSLGSGVVLMMMMMAELLKHSISFEPPLAYSDIIEFSCLDLLVDNDSDQLLVNSEENLSTLSLLSLVLDDNRQALAMQRLATVKLTDDLNEYLYLLFLLIQRK